MSASSHGPLSGLVVLDLATIFAGPAACRHLADFGADVIKVERPHAGDGARHLGECDGDDSFYWRQVGRNKRPIEIDLKSPQGREVLLRLVRDADVLVENFRPGALERLGLDPETVLLAENPGLVVLRVTGYGQTGPYADRAGFGTMAEGMSTLAHTTGQPDGPPTLPPIALADEVTGMRGAFAVLAALRHRDLTGDGQVIDISLLESLVDMVGPGPAIYHRTGQSDGRIGSRLCFSAPRNIYQCSDGYIVLSGSANQVALRVFDAIGRSDLRTDPRFTTGRARIEHVEQLDAIITEWTVRHTVEQAIETIAAAGAAVGPVYDAEALVRDRHVRERGCFVEVESPAGNDPILQLDVHPRMSLTPGRIRHAGLEPGASTDEVLAELGYDAEQIAALRAQGAVGGAAAPAVAVGLEPCASPTSRAISTSAATSASLVRKLTMHGPQVHAAVDGGRGDVDAGVALQLDGQPRVVRVQVGDAGGDVPERHDRELRRPQRLQIRLSGDQLVEQRGLAQVAPHRAAEGLRAVHTERQPQLQRAERARVLERDVDGVRLVALVRQVALVMRERVMQILALAHQDHAAGLR